RDRHVSLPGAVEFTGGKSEDRSGRVGHKRVFDRVEVRAPRLPIIGVADYLDRFIGFELDKLERASADRMGAHVARADVTGVDRRPARSEQCYEGDLRPLEAERDLMVTVGGDLFEVAVPGFARVDTQLLGRFAGDQVPGAFDVGGGERLAVM